MNHINRMAGALLETHPAARAEVVIELVAVPLAQFDDRAFRAGIVAAVALKAVAARQAALGLVAGLFLEHFIKVTRLLGRGAKLPCSCSGTLHNFSPFPVPSSLPPCPLSYIHLPGLVVVLYL